MHSTREKVVRQYVRTLGKRGNAYLFLNTDSSLSILSFPSSAAVDLARSVLASRLSRHFGIPTTEALVVYASRHVLADCRKASEGGLSYSAQTYRAFLGFNYAGCAEDGERRRIFDYLPEDYIQQGGLPATFLKKLSFDLWWGIQSSPQPVFAKKAEQDGYQPTFLNKYKFGPRCRKAAGQEDTFPLTDMTAVYREARGWHSFDSFLDEFILISPETVIEAAANLPFGWSESLANELDLEIDMLVRRRSLIRQAISKLRDHPSNPFPNWPRRVFVFQGRPVSVSEHAIPSSPGSL